MNKIKQTALAVTLILLVFVLSSCDKVTYPVPEENPIILSCKEQSVTTKIKDLSSIIPQNPETDEKIVSSETEPRWSKIESDWITVYCEWNSNLTKTVKITVSENTSVLERRYILGIKSRSKNFTLTIIQEAKR